MTKVLNFGSLNLDYVYCVDHFVQAGETISSTEMSTFCGGKGLNQSIALARAGARVYHAGAVGKDGDKLTKVLVENQVDISLVQIADVPSGHAMIQLQPNGQNCIIIFGGANQSITESHIDQSLSHFSENDYLILQNEINSVSTIMQKAKKRGMHIVLNPSPMDEKISEMPMEMVDTFILNEVEAERLCGTGDPGQIMKDLRSQFPRAAIVLTLGRRGVCYQDPSLTEPLHNGIYRVPVVDTTAAGDTFTGFFIACISKNETALRALELASKASSLAVSRKGAEPSIPTLSEVLEANLVQDDDLGNIL